MKKISRVKLEIVESAGDKLKNKLLKPNPWALEMCKQEKFGPCEVGDRRISCSATNVAYTNLCNLSKANNKLIIYTGTTGWLSRQR